MTIDHLETRILYENPKPHVHSRHGYFPGLAFLPSGDLLALFVMAEAFESPDATTWVARSRDLGRTWQVEGPLYDRNTLCPQASDTLKPVVLRDGSVIAMGYRFHREDPEQGIGIPETGGVLPGENIAAFSRDEGRTWSVPRVIPRSRPELLEISGPCIELGSGELLAVAALYPMPDGTHPSGRLGVVARSSDRGLHWDDTTVFYRNGPVIPYEPRVCRMEDGRLAAIVWAYNPDTGEHHANQLVISRDGGFSWSAPLDTGHMGQASNLLPLGGNRLATIHAHRGADPGIYVRIGDLEGGRWRVIFETAIYGAGSRRQTRPGQAAPDMFTSLRFGQPSLLRLPGDELLACHWAVEDGQGRIVTHRLRLRAGS